ncbi:hypothetical protein AGABI1DRAFT_134276 [Agaricus bisporus var. burnettii JB137-S8]|uniref:Uncharacterized protein n=1 Tax=Agaricus bisporus var. burnettii (strain JB137-S8 / ATCC MYA-4627 / FGSC 10392) TaxID=597362 RepID=K5WEL3_AGABU|nr:uncharacterized protein AGABI1DRAFT_134276 [Agaricus bisporus var. burnettii JB137-S8]EKM73681.1 hypothetical protein AGABI1DRAFT_134276 [Agaricus bisporus var. burnettii JB137-S8]
MNEQEKSYGTSKYKKLVTQNRAKGLAERTWFGGTHQPPLTGAVPRDQFYSISFGSGEATGSTEPSSKHDHQRSSEGFGSSEPVLWMLAVELVLRDHA